MIEENEQLPDWLVELRDQQIQQQSQEPSPLITPEPSGEMDRTSLMGDLRSQMGQAEEQMAQDRMRGAQAESAMAPMDEPVAEPEPEEPADMLDSLRSQMIMEAEEEEELEQIQKQSSLQPLLSLKPPQRLLLAALLFLNVAVCGCMILIMAGRVEIPAF